MRDLHQAGLAQNYRPRPAPGKRELARFGREYVRRILWISRTRLVLWSRRDRRPGDRALELHRISNPARGWALLLWSRALVALHAPHPRRH